MSHKLRSSAAVKRQARAPVFAALGDETRLALVAKLCARQPYSISQDMPKERTKRQKGSIQPMAAEPKQAATSPTNRTTYLTVCQRLYLFDSMRCLPLLASEGQLPTQCCNVPIGQIQPQKNRPRKRVGSRMRRLQISPRYREI